MEAVLEPLLWYCRRLLVDWRFLSSTNLALNWTAFLGRHFSDRLLASTGVVFILAIVMLGVDKKFCCLRRWFTIATVVLRENTGPVRFGKNESYQQDWSPYSTLCKAGGSKEDSNALLPSVRVLNMKQIRLT